MSHKERPAYKRAMERDGRWDVARYGDPAKDLYEIQETDGPGHAVPVKVVKGMAEAYRLAQEHNANIR